MMESKRIFLALIGLVFHEHIAAARQWLAWLRPVLCGIWPIWAGDDGAWAEGPSYGLAYVTGGFFGLQAGIASLRMWSVDVDLLMILAAAGAASTSSTSPTAITSVRLVRFISSQVGSWRG